MILRQFHGPFNSGKIIRVPSDYSYPAVHIGVQIPFRGQLYDFAPDTLVDTQEGGSSDSPVAGLSSLHDLPQRVSSQYAFEISNIGTIVRIGLMNQNNNFTSNENLKFHINEFGRLEFDGVANSTYGVQFLHDVPFETIVDIVYNNKLN